jgi:hypothetical protein
LVMKGRSGVIVMMDGKQVHLSGTDLTEMLKGTSAHNVEKITLISNPSARYDAAGNSGIIDVKLKRFKNLGFGGSASINGGLGKLFKSNDGLGFNYSKPKFLLSTNYNYASRGDFIDLSVFRNFSRPQDGMISFLQDTYQRINFRSHTPKLNMEYHLTKGLTLDISASFTKIKRDVANVTSLYDSADELIGFRTMENNAGNHKENFGANINLRQKLDTLGNLLSLDIDVAKFDNDHIQSYDFSYLDRNSNPSQASALFYSEGRGRLNIASGGLNVEKSIAGGKLELGTKLSWVASMTDVNFFNRIGSTLESNAHLSGRFNYTEQIQSLFANYSRNSGRLTFQFGVRAERTEGTGKGGNDFDRRYAHLFPSGAISYQLTEAHGFGANFSRRIGRPNYAQLNPQFYFIENSTKVTGNPRLLPALNYSADINYTFRSRYIISLNYFYSANPIVEDQTLDDAGNIVIGFANLRRYISSSVVFTLPINITRWLTSINNLSCFYGTYSGMVSGRDRMMSSRYATINSNNSFSLGNFSAQVIGSYNGKQYYGTMEIKPSASLDFAFQRGIWNKRATLGVNITDVLYSDKFRWTNSLQDFNSSARWRRDSRSIMLNFSYKFGSNNVGSRKTGSAEEEKGRAN